MGANLPARHRTLSQFTVMRFRIANVRFYKAAVGMGAVGLRDSRRNGVCRLRPADAGFVGQVTKEEDMARKSNRTRLEEQRKRQANLRTDAKACRRPGRDDFARMLLWLMIREAAEQARRQGASGSIDRLATLLVGRLVQQGFDPTDMMPFRIKRHLDTST